MVSPITEFKRPISVLEVGPGTGPFTRRILELLGPEDSFTICEINHRFMKRLKEKLSRNECFVRNKDRVHFFEGPVQRLPEAITPCVFDVIVSSLPFSNFTADTVDEIMALYWSMLKQDGVLTYFEYVGFRKLSALFPSQRNRRRVEGVDAVVRRWRNDLSHSGKVSKRLSLLNIPPAMTLCCRH